MKTKHPRMITRMVITFIISTLLMPLLASAEPYVAQRYGLKCSACHTNMTGGGKRNAVGNGYAMGLTESVLATTLSTQLGEGISIGANFRADWTYNQFDDPKPDAGSNTAPPIDEGSAFNISNGALYLEFGLTKDITFYLDQQVAPEGGRTREAVAIYRGLGHEDAYLKVGKFFLPYGLRLQDDKAFIRENSGFNFDNSDVGLEYGIDTGPWSLALAVTNGTQGAGENNTDKQVSVVGSYVQPTYRVGLSATKNNGTNGFSRQGFNVFAGLTLDKWVFLWELDQFENTAPTGQTDQLMSFLSVNYLLTPSLNLKLSYDYIDPNDNVDEDERTRVSLIGEKFVNQFTQLRGGVRLYDGIPQNPLQNQQVLFTELHLFF